MQNTNNMVTHINQIIFCGQAGDPMMHPHITKFVDHALTITESVRIHTNGGLRSTNWYKHMGDKHGQSLEIVFGIDNMTTYAQTSGISSWDFLVFEWNYHQIPEVAIMAKENNVEVEYKINTQKHGLLDTTKMSMVEEMICQANTI